MNEQRKHRVRLCKVDKREHLRKSDKKPKLWKPNWKPEIAGWTVTFIKENNWRCSDIVNSFEDLLQEAYIVFLRIKTTYPLVNTPKQFMALYKKSFTNYVIDLSRYKQRKEAVHVTDLPCDAIELGSGRIGEIENSGYVMSLLERSSEELKTLLLVYNDEAKLVKLREKYLRTSRKPRPNLNRRLCSLAGIEPKKDYIKELKNLLDANSG